MDVKRMEQAVRNIALLAALAGFLGFAPAMSKDAQLASWIYSCARSDRTQAVIPAFTTAIERFSAPRSAVRATTERFTDAEGSAQTVSNRNLPDRDEFSVWTPNPVVSASVLR